MTTTTMQNDYDILEQNNIGVTHLMNGDIKKAHQSLRTAFAMAKQCVVRHNNGLSQQQQQQQHERQHDSSRTQERPHLLSSWRQDSIEMLKSMTTSSFGAGRAETINQGLFIHKDCVSVPCSSRRRQGAGRKRSASGELLQPGDVNWALVSAFICFNLGVVYSASAMVNSTDQGSYSLHAKSSMMYDSCRQLLLSCCGTSARASALPPTLLATGNPLVDLLCLSTLAKLAETNYGLSNLDVARSFSSQLDAFVWTLQANPIYSGDSEMRELLEMNFARLSTVLTFFRNEDQKLLPMAIAPAA